MKPIKIVKTRGRGITKSNRGSEYDQSTFYACMENHNETPYSVQLIYSNKKLKLNVSWSHHHE
jgi:hypothetical protein